jgi:Tol biopolymer transport system component
MIVVATIATAVTLATLGFADSARATYPGATNGRLAFGMNINGNTDVYSVQPNGQDLQRLTTDPGFDACAAYSADGRRIAYCSGQGGGPVQVWTMKQDGTDKQQVTHMSATAISPTSRPTGASSSSALARRPSPATSTSSTATAAISPG